MSNLAIDDALTNGLEPNTEGSYGTPITETADMRTKMQTMDMIDSSMYGTGVKFNFINTAQSVSETVNGAVVTTTDPASEPNLPSDTITTATSDANVYLTFSGGGHELEFATSI